LKNAVKKRSTSKTVLREENPRLRGFLEYVLMEVALEHLT
jgi:hypothetical protein